MTEEHRKPMLHSDFVTPPIKVNAKFKLVYMSGVDEAKAKILDVTKETDKKYSGIATRGLTYCPAITLIEKDELGKINKILMSHLAGNVGEKNLNSLFSQAKGALTQIDEMIICPGLASDEAGIKRYHEEIEEFFNTQPKMRPQSIYYSDPSVSHCVTIDGYSGSFPYQPYTQLGETEVQLCLSEEQAAFESFLKWESSKKFKIFYDLLGGSLVSLKKLLETTETSRSDEDLLDEDSESEEDAIASENQRKHAELYNKIRRYVYTALFDPQIFQTSRTPVYKDISRLLDELLPHKKRSIIEKINQLMSCIHSNREKLFSQFNLKKPIAPDECKAITKGTKEDKDITRRISSTSSITPISGTAFTRFEFDISSASAYKKEMPDKTQTEEVSKEKTAKTDKEKEVFKLDPDVLKPSDSDEPKYKVLRPN